MDVDTCKACHADCATCSAAGSNKCESCDSGFFLDPVAPSTTVGTCEECAPGCEECETDAEDCEDLIEGYATATPENNEDCSDGFYYKALDDTCAACDNSCLTCTAAGASSCDSCAEGEYLTDTNTCADCGGDCLTCEGSATTCTSTCADGFYFDDGGCLPCAIGCNTCSDDSSCTDYKTGYDAAEPDASNDCSDGYYYKSSDGTCDACEANCEACDNANTCTDCYDGYYLSGGSCF